MRRCSRPRFALIQRLPDASTPSETMVPQSMRHPSTPELMRASRRVEMAMEGEGAFGRLLLVAKASEG